MEQVWHVIPHFEALKKFLLWKWPSFSRAPLRSIDHRSKRSDDWNWPHEISSHFYFKYLLSHPYLNLICCSFRRRGRSRRACQRPWGDHVHNDEFLRGSGRTPVRLSRHHSHSNEIRLHTPWPKRAIQVCPTNTIFFLFSLFVEKSLICMRDDTCSCLSLLRATFLSQSRTLESLFCLCGALIVKSQENIIK